MGSSKARATSQPTTDHDDLVRLATQFEGHTAECSERYAESRRSMDEMKVTVEKGLVEIKAMVAAAKDTALAAQSAVTAASSDLNSRVTKLSDRVFNLMLSVAGVIIIGLISFIVTILMYGRPWDHIK